MLTGLGGLGEFERDLIRFHTGEGTTRAVARGQKMGRLPKLIPAKATPNNKRIFCQAPHFVMARLVRATFRGMCGNRWPGQAVP